MVMSLLSYKIWLQGQGQEELCMHLLCSFYISICRSTSIRPIPKNSYLENLNLKLKLPKSNEWLLSIVCYGNNFTAYCTGIYYFSDIAYKLQYIGPENSQLHCNMNYTYISCIKFCSRLFIVGSRFDGWKGHNATSIDCR